MSKLHSKKVICIFCICAAVMLTSAVLFCLSRSGYRQALRDYFDGISTNSAEKCFDALIPDDVADYYKKDEDHDFDYIVMLFGSWSAETGYSKLHAYCEHYDLSDDLKITFKITGRSELSSSELQEYEDNYNYLFDAVSLKATKGYELSLDITIKGDSGKTENINGTAVAVKINGDWVIPNGIDCDIYENL